MNLLERIKAALKEAYDAGYRVQVKEDKDWARKLQIDGVTKLYESLGRGIALVPDNLHGLRRIAFEAGVNKGLSVPFEDYLGIPRRENYPGYTVHVR